MVRATVAVCLQVAPAESIGGTRCNVRRYVLSFVTCALLAAGAYAQEAQPGADHGKPAQLSQITVEGRQITGDDLYVRKNGTTYVSLPALARALGASVVSQGPVAVLSIPALPETLCGETAAALQLSDSYRKAAVHIPDEIEVLRLQALKPGALIPAASFDDIDHQISEADFRAKTEADRSVSYALSHANSTLAIMYYKLRRGVPVEYAKQGQMDLDLCTLESKYALAVGRLSGKEMCSVFQADEKQAETKRAASN
jgi:hypothetical protein